MDVVSVKAFPLSSLFCQSFKLEKASCHVCNVLIALVLLFVWVPSTLVRKRTEVEREVGLCDPGQ
jgi:hypothetical protein